MITLNNKARRALIQQAHTLHPIVIIGQNGLTEAIIAETNRALNDHELIKIRIRSSEREERREVAQQLSEALEATHLQSIGQIAIFYRESDKESKQAKS